MVDTATRTYALPKPDTRLREFEQFIGTWDMKGRTLDSDVDNVTARATFEYLPGGFFIAQRFKADFVGTPIESLGDDRLRPRERHVPIDRLREHGRDAPGLPLGARWGRCDDHDRRARCDVPGTLEWHDVLRRLAAEPWSRRPRQRSVRRLRPSGDVGLKATSRTCDSGACPLTRPLVGVACSGPSKE